MRTQYCREHLTNEVAEKCGIDKRIVSDVYKAAKFCDEHCNFLQCPTTAIMALIRVRDDPVREKAISSIEKSLDSGKHPLTGKIIKDKKLTERDIKKVIENAEREVRGEVIKEIKKARKESYNGTPQKDDFKDAAPVEPAKPLSQTSGFTVRTEPALAASEFKRASEVPTPNEEAKVIGEVLVAIPNSTAFQDPAKRKRAERDYLAEQLLERFPDSIKVAISDLLRENTSWKAADAFYFGILALAEKKVVKKA